MAHYAGWSGAHPKVALKFLGDTSIILTKSYTSAQNARAGLLRTPARAYFLRYEGEAEGCFPSHPHGEQAHHYLAID